MGGLAVRRPHFHPVSQNPPADRPKEQSRPETGEGIVRAGPDQHPLPPVRAGFELTPHVTFLIFSQTSNSPREAGAKREPSLGQGRTQG